mgnify:CR=1 FL=1
MGPITPLAFLVPFASLGTAAEQFVTYAPF